MSRDAKYLAALMALLLAGAAWGAPLEIAVRPTFDGEPLRLDSLRYTNAAGETLSVSRLSYLLSGFALQREDGTWVEIPGQYAWMDAAQQRSVVRIETPPAGKYRAVRFYIGLDDAANAGKSQAPAEDPLNGNLDGLRDEQSNRPVHRRHLSPRPIP